MRSLVPTPRLLVPALLVLGLAGCSRTDDRASAPAAGPAPVPSIGQDAAPVAGGPTTLKPGLWKTVAQTPAGPGARSSAWPTATTPAPRRPCKVSPCGSPEMTRTVDGFRVDLACEKDHIDYVLSGTVRGDFVTTAQTDLQLEVSAFGRRQTLRMKAVSTYQGDCRPGDPVAGKTAAP